MSSGELGLIYSPPQFMHQMLKCNGEQYFASNCIEWSDQFGNQLIVSHHTIGFIAEFLSFPTNWFEAVQLIENGSPNKI